MHYWDYAALACLGIVLPLVFWRTWPGTAARLREGLPGVRSQLYRRTIVFELVLTAVVCSGWSMAGRSWRALGFTVGGGAGFWLGLGVVLVAAALLALQARAVTTRPAFAEQMRQELEPLSYVSPHDEDELWWFRALSLTVSLSEEIVYRGYVMWALAELGGALLAIVGSTAIFTVGHLYQHPGGVLRVAGVGLVAAAVYWLSGSLLTVVILHAAIDLSSASMAFCVNRGRAEEAAAVVV